MSQRSQTDFWVHKPSQAEKERPCLEHFIGGKLVAVTPLPDVSTYTWNPPGRGRPRDVWTAKRQEVVRALLAKSPNVYQVTRLLYPRLRGADFDDAYRGMCAVVKRYKLSPNR